MKEQLVTSLQGALRPDEINCGIKVILKKKNVCFLFIFFSSVLPYKITRIIIVLVSFFVMYL